MNKVNEFKMWIIERKGNPRAEEKSIKVGEKNGLIILLALCKDLIFFSCNLHTRGVLFEC